MGYEFKSGFQKNSSFNDTWIFYWDCKKDYLQNKIPEFYPFNLQDFFNQLANLFEKISMKIS